MHAETVGQHQESSIALSCILFFRALLFVCFVLVFEAGSLKEFIAY